MAYTQVHSIKNTLGKSLTYIKNKDKTTFVGSKDDIKDALNYISNPNKTKHFVFVEGYMCDPEYAELQFGETRKNYLAAHGGKERNTSGKPALAWHLIQSFPPDVKSSDVMAPELVHQMGMELAERVGEGKYQCVVSTHVEGSNCLHNHLIFSAYPLDAQYGKKYHRSAAEYRRIKKISDEIGMKYGIEPIPDKGISYESQTIGEISAKRKGGSWKQKVKEDIQTASEASGSWDEYKDIMQANGYTIEEHNGYIRYQTPYSVRAVRDRTLGEAFEKDSLMKVWNPAYIPEQRKNVGLDGKPNKYNGYDSQERACWAEAQRLSALESKKTKIKVKGSLYRVSRYDANGNRRSNFEMLILTAMKVIKNDGPLFEDQVGAKIYPNSPLYAPRDWKLQSMLKTSNLASEMRINEVSDIAVRMQELTGKLGTISTSIRKKKAYLNRIGSLRNAIQDYNNTKDLVSVLDVLPEEQKVAYKEEHREKLAKYNTAMTVFNRFSGRNATTPIMVYNPQLHKRCVSLENIGHVLENVEKTEQEINELQEKRKAVARDISKVRRVRTGLSLAQNGLFICGPKYTQEKFDEIHKKAMEAEKSLISDNEKLGEMNEDEFGEYMDEVFRKDPEPEQPETNSKDRHFEGR